MHLYPRCYAKVKVSETSMEVLERGREMEAIMQTWKNLAYIISPPFPNPKEVNIKNPQMAGVQK